MRIFSPRCMATRTGGSHSPRMPARNETVYAKALEIIRKAGQQKPDLCVFDLDYCTWPYWCEVYSPSQTNLAQLFPETREIFDACKASQLPMAVASRSPTPRTARAFLSHLGLAQVYFESIIIKPYVGKHEVHFPQLKKELGIEYEDMLFFDDEGGNIRQVSKLGVTSILVSTATGVCLQSFEEGMKAFARNKGNRKSSRLDP